MIEQCGICRERAAPMTSEITGEPLCIQHWRQLGEHLVAQTAARAVRSVEYAEKVAEELRAVLGRPRKQAA